MSKISGALFHSSQQVVWGLLTYTDWWQPFTTSVIPVGPARRDTTFHDGIRPGLVETLDERAELCRRVRLVPERDRRLLFSWYVRQLPAEEIARELGVSIRHCFRLRRKAIRRIVDLGKVQEAT